MCATLVLCTVAFSARLAIDPNQYLNDIKFLASPEMKGRATGSPELEKAANWIAGRFKDQQVVVLGMNTDTKEEDARFVVEKMGLNYTNLKAAGLPEKYKVQVFPTLVVIDQDGVVRDIHVGYSPTLKEEVVKSVERLLKAKP